MQTTSNLNKIALITFDTFGTLLDWQAYVENAMPARYREFLAASARRQSPGYEVFPYTKLLAEVYTEVLPKAGPSQAQAFAQNFGRSPTFGDVGVLLGLRQQFLLGCISNCDFRHQIDVQQQLGFVWDICITAEGLESYKPSPTIWEKARDRVRLELGIKPEQWLHVAAYLEFDLEPAAKLGIRTCYIPRPGGSPAIDAQHANISTMVSDLNQLEHALMDDRPSTLRFRVTAHAHDAKVADAFIRWMRDEHGHDLLAIKGCGEFRVVRQSPETISCEYLFRSKELFDEYVATKAPRLRERGRTLFPENLIKFERDEATVVARGEKRKMMDFR